MKRFLGGVETVEVPYEPLESGMGWLLGELPIERPIVVPLSPLTEFGSHEQELFPGMSEQVAIEAAKIGELAPRITGHFQKQRAFSMNDLVVRQWEDELPAEGVHQRKGQ